MSDLHMRRYDGSYDRGAFYAKMGRFFAEEPYSRQMPYLRNKPEKVWFTVERDGEVIAFSSLDVKAGYVEFTTEYVESRYRRKGLFRALTEARFLYCRDMKLPIRTSTSIGFIRDYYVRRGFEVYRETKNYWFLRRDGQEAADEKGKGAYASRQLGTRRPDGTDQAAPRTDGTGREGPGVEQDPRRAEQGLPV
ncbi:MAG: GNAT family N-acetyltransferase [Coriobacteriales bacterium]|jgi:predicted GNAT family acetyltransferase|nr:GNAT family N-acetyltransferase [Coriobacteriales bacterium]